MTPALYVFGLIGLGPWFFK